MEWKTKGGVVLCAMEPEEFESLRETLKEARDTTMPLSQQNFPADYAATLLEAMSAMAELRGWESWTPEEDATLAAAWRAWGQTLSHRAFTQRLRAETPHPALAGRSEKAVALRLSKLGLVKARRPKAPTTQGQEAEEVDLGRQPSDV